MVSSTPKLSLKKLLENQTTGRTRMNESLSMFDSFVGGLTLVAMGQNTPPVSPADGDAYEVGSSPTGAYVGHAGEIAVYENDSSTWLFLTPQGGLVAEDTGSSYKAGEKMVYSEQESQWYPMHLRYSTTEYWTGRYGTGGTKLYGKYIALAALPNTTSKNYAHSITNLDLNNLIELRGFAENGSLNFVIPTTSNGNETAVRIDATNVVVVTNWNASTYDGGALVLYERT